MDHYSISKLNVPLVFIYYLHLKAKLFLLKNPKAKQDQGIYPRI